MICHPRKCAGDVAGRSVSAVMFVEEDFFCNNNNNNNNNKETNTYFLLESLHIPISPDFQLPNSTIDIKKRVSHFPKRLFSPIIVHSRDCARFVTFHAC